MSMRGNMGPGGFGRWLLGALLAAVALPALAQTGPITTQTLFFDDATNVHKGNYLDAQTGIIYSTNVGLTHDGAGDTLAMIGLIGDVKREDAPRLDYHINSDIVLVKYFSSSFQTQPFGYFDGSADFKIIPGLFSWTARDSFNQVVIDQFAPATPDNLESLNYASTGPRLTFQPTLRTSIVLDGTYSYVNSSSKSPDYVNIDNHREGADGKIERGFSNNLTGYITLTYDKVQFTDTVNNTDFSQKAGLVGFRYNDARTLLDGSAGYTAVDLTDPPAGTTDAKPSGVVWSIDASRVITPTQRLSGHAGKQVTDAPNLFRLDVSVPTPGGTGYQIATGQPFTHRDYSLAYHIDGVRTFIDLSAAATSDKYEITPADNRDTKLISAVVLRTLNLNWKADLDLSYENDQYDAGGSLKQFNLLASLRWRVGERLGVRFIFAHTSISPNDISENQIGVTVAYNLIGHGGKPVDSPDAPGLPATPLRPTNPATQPRL